MLTSCTLLATCHAFTVTTTVTTQAVPGRGPAISGKHSGYRETKAVTKILSSLNEDTDTTTDKGIKMDLSDNARAEFTVTSDIGPVGHVDNPMDTMTENGTTTSTLRLMHGDIQNTDYEYQQDKTVASSVLLERRESNGAYITSSESSDPYDPMNEVLLESHNPFIKWIEADVSDSTMRIVSSELGVKEFVRTIKSKSGGGLPDSSQVPVDLLLSRGVDTLEDITLHLSRIPYRKRYRDGDITSGPLLERKRRTVVILGSGWAAHALIKVADCCKLRLIVVSPSNHFVFTPMLASSAVGTVEYRSMTEAVRAANPYIDDYLEGKATDVDVHNKKEVFVQLKSLLDGAREGKPPMVELEYDHLIVSVGCRVEDRGIPGVEKAFRLKTTDDAVKLRRAIGECLEYASRPDVAGPDHVQERRNRATFLIVGGGPTGVELAGEMLDLAADITRSDKGTYPKLNGDIQVVLVHSGPDLVPQFEKTLRLEALKSLEKKGAKVLLNTRVNEVGDGFAKLATKRFDPTTGQVVSLDEFSLPVGGTAPVDFVDRLLAQLPPEARNPDGRIKVDKWLRPQMPSNDLVGSVLVLGDAAAFPEGSEIIATDRLLPQTAQVAGQQGAYAARLLTRGYNMSVLPAPLLDEAYQDIDPLMVTWLQLRGITRAPPFQFLNLGLLAYLGGNEALSQVQIGDFPLFSYFGSIAFVLWRSVYLVKQV
eukprot:CAMPEP_0170215400 /NCGR_PEP_ID=MMETSP0116_2-20130129/7336_1 /TAXON_ID=400756 /ORGANISM="Durinskia baltica, Strain CSIRO CS-38" /LENGTH=707 /DNA_ID=CAMNT_0010465975 /DNA_START=1 /DNA_END=2122 /DNA_ORIENTATION=-